MPTLPPSILKLLEGVVLLKVATTPHLRLFILAERHLTDSTAIVRPSLHFISRMCTNIVLST